MTRIAVVIAAASVLGGCQCGQSQAGAGGAGAGANDAGTPAASAQGTSSVSTSGDAPVVTLASGAKLRLPAGAVVAKAPSLPLDEVKAAHLFHVGGDTRRLLMVNEIDLGGKSCEAKLDEEWKKMERSRADTDARRLEERKISSIEDLQVGGRRVLYSDSQRHQLLGSDGTRRSAPLATAVMCSDAQYIALVYATDQPTTPEESKRMLLDVLSSYTR